MKRSTLTVLGFTLLAGVLLSVALVATAYALVWRCYYCNMTAAGPSAHCVPGGVVTCIHAKTLGHPKGPTAVVTSTVPPTVGSCAFSLFSTCNKTFPCNSTCSACGSSLTAVDAVGVNECI